MGACLHFRSIEPVAPTVEASLRAETLDGQANQPWVLCEPPHLYGRNQDGQVFGSSKLNLMPDLDELAAATRATVDRHDLDALLDRLCRWSRDHGVTWELDIEGQPLGTIVAGVCDDEVRGALQCLAGLAGELALPEDVDSEPEPSPVVPDFVGPRLWIPPED